MNALLEQLVALPIVVPLLTGAVLLLLTEAQRVARSRARVHVRSIAAARGRRRAACT